MKEKRLVLLDIDGTLADNSHRQHLVSSPPKRWHEFFTKMTDDIPNVAVVNLYRTLCRSGDYDVVLVTARPEKYRSVTEDWLRRYNIDWTMLLMRADGDFRPDAEIKREMLDKLKCTLDEIVFVIDDRTQTVRMWRSLGLTCFQCADHDF
ncbi:MAG: hypothetical protein OXC41_02250 [Gammaproteobacteria bacterium]|nr:hypothetical protein [Gammaproteobacteria bacterium]